MKRLCCFVWLVCLAFCFKAQLSGSAFLNGQNTHSGIKVRFMAVSPTAVSDSTYTNANGSYSINISFGGYNVDFSKNGYQTLQYNTGSTILTSTTVLPGVTLDPGNVINVSGIVSGTWTPGNIYVVNSDITIQNNDSLIIQPGVVVKFNGYYALTANGKLRAKGTAANKIRFTSNLYPQQTKQWNSLNLYNSQCNIINCVIEYCNSGVIVQQSVPDIEDSEIRYFSGAGILCKGGIGGVGGLIKNNDIHDFKMIDQSAAIYLENINSTVECNSIYDGFGYGIYYQDNSTIRNNNIYNISTSSSGPGGKGIYCYNNSTSRVENNLVHHCDFGISIGENSAPGPHPLILNNTLYDNPIGIYLPGFYGSPVITANIITKSSTAGILQNSQAAPADVSYNLFWYNSADLFNVTFPGVGANLSPNSHGDLTDGYKNIFSDPLFQNNLPPNYAPNSPCVAAGNPNYSSNIGCNTAQMCSSMVLGVNEKAKEISFTVFPNPFVSSITLSGLDLNSISKISLVDLSGRSYPVQIIENSEAGTRVLMSDLPGGTYFMEVCMHYGSKKYARLIKN